MQITEQEVKRFTDDGLIDVLPIGVAKGFALDWWRSHCRYTIDEVVYAGDSGSDFAAFCTGVLSVLVENAHDDVVAYVMDNHPKPEAVFHSSRAATGGVLEGLQHFLDQ